MESRSNQSRPRAPRAFKPKVKSGCLTCRIKCDEAKPACKRCSTTGRTCDGYESSFRFFNPETRSGSPFATPDSRSRRGSLLPQEAIMSMSPALVGWGTAEECRAFSFYKLNAGPALSGEVGSSFWTKLVPRLCHTEPAVRHAVLSLSVLYELQDKGKQPPTLSQADNESRFAIQQYTKAMSHLRAWRAADGQPAAVPLLVCLLFVCIEFLRYHIEPSLLHIQQGLQILANLDSESNSPEMEMIKQELIPIYSRLAIAAYLQDPHDPPRIPDHLKIWGSAVVPGQFSSVAEASSLLYELLSRSFRFTREAKPLAYNPQADPMVILDLETRQSQILSSLSQWGASFGIWLSLNPGSISTAAADVLRIWQQVSLIWVGTVLSPLEMAYDSYTPQFTSIIGYASSIMHCRSVAPTTAHSQAKALPKFTFETEIIPLLFYTATKCRQPLVRRTAVKLLLENSRNQRWENLWDPGFHADVAVRVIELEETRKLANWTRQQDYENYVAAGFADTGERMSDNEADVVLLDPARDHLKVPINSLPNIRLSAVKQFKDPSEFSAEFVANAEAEALQRIKRLEEREKEILDPCRARTASPMPVPSLVDSDLGRSPTPQPLVNDILESPYNLPEVARIKYVAIGRLRDGGNWVTFFREPLNGLATDWEVWREFLRAAGAPGSGQRHPESAWKRSVG